LVERARSLAQDDSGMLRVGATPQMIESISPGLLTRYARQCPGVHVRPVEAGAVVQVAMLEREDIHLGIGLRPEDERRFAICALPQLHVLVAHAPSLPIRSDGKEVEVGVLSEVPLLLLDRSFGTRKLFDAASRLARLSLASSSRARRRTRYSPSPRQGSGLPSFPTPYASRAKGCGSPI
jgi:DNA-binding transcriptional LysR family regulator